MTQESLINIFDAIHQGDDEAIITWLTSSYRDFQIRNLEGFTPAEYAVIHNKLDYVETFLFQADAKEMNQPILSLGVNPLQYGIDHGWIDMVNLMLRFPEIDVDPSHLNSVVDQPILFEALLKNAIQYDRKPTLIAAWQSAVQNGRLDLLDILFKNQFNFDLKDENGKTAYQVARGLNQEQVLLWFMKHDLFDRSSERLITPMTYVLRQHMTRRCSADQSGSFSAIKPKKMGSV